jgi:hypothetical protein
MLDGCRLNRARDAQKMKDGIIRTYDGVRKLYIPVKALVREKHRADLTAVRGAIQVAHNKGARFEGTGALDKYFSDTAKE